MGHYQFSSSPYSNLCISINISNFDFNLNGSYMPKDRSQYVVQSRRVSGTGQCQYLKPILSVKENAIMYIN
jgi:hypothetical protein